MSAIAPACFIGLDMGTTNTRAWRIEGGAILASARAPVGIRDSAVGGGAEVLRTAVRELVETLSGGEGAPPRALVAAGMITSSHGLAEVPHLEAPVGAPELSAGMRRYRLPEIGALPVYLIPGVMTGPRRSTPDSIGEADVMRGEETLCVGLNAAGILPSGATLLNLGSHWKTVRLDGAGRIAGSTTSLSGELLHAAQTRTILAGSVPPQRPEGLDSAWAHRGLRECRRSGLERALFCVRLLEQRTESTPEERLSYLVGAFVGSALPLVVRELAATAPLVIAGGGPTGGLFAEVLAGEGSQVRVLSRAEVEGAMARGLSLIASAALENEG